MEETQVVLRTKLIDQQGVAAEFGVPVNSQRHLRSRGQFPAALRIGRRLYYRRSVLEDWLAQREAEAMEGARHGFGQPDDAAVAASAAEGAQPPAEVEQQVEFIAASEVMPP